MSELSKIEFILISMGPIDVQWESGNTYLADAT